MADPVDITIVGGFLGAGKTTFVVDRLLAADRGGTLVVLNELGTQATETALLAGGPLEILAGGCICCDLAPTLLTLLTDAVRGARRPRPARIVLETTGLAYPARLVELLQSDPLLRHHTRLREVVVVTDVLNAPGTLAAHDEAAMQLAAADRIVLSKTDLATPAQTEAVAHLVRTLNPTAALEGAPEPEAAAAPTATSPAPPSRPAAGGHLEGVATLSLELDAPLDWQVFGVWLTLLVHAHADRLLRFKASIDSGGPGPVLLDAVQAAVHPPRHLPTWGDAPRRSRLTFITRDLDTALLEPSLAAFQAAFGAQDGVASADSPISRTPASSSSSSSRSPS